MFAFDHVAAARTTARILLEIEAVHFRPSQPFTLTSGRVSPVYIDCRKLISFPRARRQVIALAAQQIADAVGYESLDAIAGGETAGIPYAAWLADALSLPMLYIRKQPKGFGRGAQIEGNMKEGQRVLLVEDLATDGSSKVNFIHAIRNAGGQVSHAFVVFHYGIFPEGIARLQALGVTLHSLAEWEDVLTCAESFQKVSAKEAAEIRRFLADPEGWSLAHGGKPVSAPASA